MYQPVSLKAANVATINNRVRNLCVSFSRRVRANNKHPAIAKTYKPDPLLCMTCPSPNPRSTLQNSCSSLLHECHEKLRNNRITKLSEKAPSIRVDQPCEIISGVRK